MRAQLMCAAAVALCLPVLAACGSGDDPSGAKKSDVKVDPAVAAWKTPSFDLSGQKITFSTATPEASNMGTFFMMEKLAEWGATTDLVTLTTTSGIQAMAANQIDVAAFGGDEVIVGLAKGAKVEAIGSPRAKQSYLLVTKKDINSVKDLKGKKIAMFGPGGYDATLMSYTLGQEGMKPKDLQYVQVGSAPDRGAALVSGAVDATVIFHSTYSEIADKADNLHVLVDFAETTDFPADAFYLETDYAKKNPDVPLAIACGNLAANAWIASSEDDFVDFTSRHVKGASEDAARVVWERGQQVGMYPTDPTQVIVSNGFNDLAQAMVKSGDIKKAPDLSSAINTSYLQKAADMGCAEAK